MAGEQKKQSTLIGVRDVVFAILKKDDKTGAEYETDIIEEAGVIEIVLTPNVSDEALGADDNPVYEQMTALDSIDAAVTQSSIRKATEAKLLGHKIDTKGVMIKAADDVAPDVAMGFKSAKVNGKDRYIWLLKGKFKPSDQTFRTKEKGTVNWNTPKLAATFGPRDYDKLLQLSVDTDDEGVSATVLDGFFTKPYAPALTP